MARVGELLAALELQVATVQRVEAGHLDLPSRCEGWTIRQVLNHSLGITLKFADFAAGRTDEPHAPQGDLLDPDHRVAATRVIERARAAWSTADMSRTCPLSFGVFAAGTAAGINLFDALAHTWDIADVISLDSMRTTSCVSPASALRRRSSDRRGTRTTMHPRSRSPLRRL